MDGYMGYVTLFAGTFAPNNWAYCNGQLLPIRAYTSLFSILGTIYGGDGVSTFALPDLRGRAVVGAGQGFSFYNLGQTGGQEFAGSLITDQLPAHNHAAQVGITSPAAGVANTKSPAGAVYAVSASNLYNLPPNTFLAAYNGTLSTAVMGSDNPKSIPTLHPALGLSYIICTTGEFPPRNE